MSHKEKNNTPSDNNNKRIKFYASEKMVQTDNTPKWQFNFFFKIKMLNNKM